jgi:hypothetical protein
VRRLNRCHLWMLASTLTLCIESYVIAGAIMKGEKLPMPDDITCGLNMPNADFKNIEGLRGNKNGAYKQFLRLFLKKGAVGIREWKVKFGTTLISTFVSVQMEAFTVTLYLNGYYAWMHEYRPILPGGASNNDEITDVSEMTKGETSGNVSYQWTSDSRVSRKNEGWKRAGMDMYDAVEKALAVQRSDKKMGENLDKAVYCKLLNGEKLLEERAPSRKRARLSDLIRLSQNTGG